VAEKREGKGMEREKDGRSEGRRREEREGASHPNILAYNRP